MSNTTKVFNSHTGKSEVVQHQPLTEYGFIDFNGNAWCDGWVDSYNNFTNAINRSTYKTERETLLDNRHKQFVQFLELSKGEEITPSEYHKRGQL